MSKLILLRENFNKDWNIKEKSLIKPQRLTLNENNNKLLYESNSYSVLSAFRIPIWVLDTKNQNNRVYPYSLGEKIVNENPITPVLDGHPEDDYIVTLKDVIAVAKNPQIISVGINKVLYTDVYIIDEAYDKKIKKATDLGLFFEESSSGYGELDEKGCVITETYQIERLCDLLVNESSYQVSFGKENEIVKDNDDNIILSDKKDNLTKENNNTNYISNKEKELKEDYIKEKNYMNYQDKTIKRDIKFSLKEAKRNSNLQEKLESLKDISTCFQDFSEMDESINDLQKEVKSLVKITEKEIIDLAEKGKEIDAIKEEKEKTVKSLDEAKTKIDELNKSLNEKTEELEKLQKQIEMAVTEMDKSKEIYTNLKEMYNHKNVENNSLIDPKDYLNIQKQYEKTNKKLEIAIKELNSIKENYISEEIQVSLSDALEEEKDKTDDKDDDDDDKKDSKDKKDDKDDDSKSDKKDKDDDSKSDKKDKDDDKDTKDEKKKKKESVRHSKIKPRKITEEIEKGETDPNKVFSDSNIKESVSYKYKKKHKNIKIEEQSEKVESYINDLINRHGDQITERFMSELEECSTLEEVQTCYLKNRPSLNRIKEIHSKNKHSIFNKEDDNDNDSIRMKRYKESLNNDPIAKNNNWL